MERRDFLTTASGLVGAGLAAAHDDPPGASATGVRAKWLRTVADDFIVDVWRNGKKIPDAQRTLEHEIFGATVEFIRTEVMAGDWLAFHVVNNRLRWGGVKYFALAGFVADGEITLESDVESGRWSVCDDPREAEKFVASRDYLSNRKPEVIAVRWDQGDTWMSNLTGGLWKGKPIWGKAASTWIKCKVT